MAEKITVVVYNHRHGQDVWLSRNETEAIRSIITEIKNYADELDPVDWTKVSRLIQKECYAEAIAQYEELHPKGEAFEIYSCDMPAPAPEPTFEPGTLAAVFAQEDSNG